MRASKASLSPSPRRLNASTVMLINRAGKNSSWGLVSIDLVSFRTLDIPEPFGKVATDQTGRFPILSSLGHQYIMVAYVHDTNEITAIPIKNRSEFSLVDAYSKLYANLKASGLAPKLQVCNNKCPAAFKHFLSEKDIHLQLVPPYDHWTNPAKRSIDTFKCHFMVGLASLPPSFLLHLWC